MLRDKTGELVDICAVEGPGKNKKAGARII